MFNPNFLLEALQMDFDPRSLRDGQELFQNNAVLDISISNNSFHAKVLDIRLYEVFFEKFEDPHFIFFEGDCSCGEPACKHQAATLYATVNRLRKEVDHKPVMALPSKLEGKHAGEYRLLPLDNGLKYALHQYHPKRFQNIGWNSSFEGKFISPNEIELIAVSQTMYGYNSTNQKIRLKEENNKVFVKCFTCTSKEKTLCTHQMALLSAAIKPLEDFDFSNFQNSYKTIFENAAARLNNTPAIIEQYFDIKILPDGPKIVGKHGNMVSQQWIDEAQNIANQHKKFKKDLITKETLRLQEGRTQQYAFIWCNQDDYERFQPLDILFAKGGSYKNKPGIKDLVKNIEALPIGFPRKIQSLGQQFFFHNQEENPELQFIQFKKLIEENMELLNQIYQYTYNGIIAYHPPKVSDLNLVEFDSDPLSCTISFEIIDGFIHLTRHMTHANAPFEFEEVVYSNPIFCSTKKRAYLYPNYRFQEFMSMFPPQHDTIILPMMDEIEKTNLVNQFKSYFEVSMPPNFTLEEEILPHVKYQILLREAGNFVLFEPRISFGEYSFNAFEKEAYFIADKLYRVDTEDLDFLIGFLKKAHPQFDNSIQVQDYVYLDLKEMINNYWFIRFNEACEAAGIEVLGQKDLSKFNYSRHRANTYMHIKSGIDWFDVQAGVSFGEEKIKTADWIRALRNKETFIKLKDGSLGMLPEEWIKQASKILAVADVEKGKLKISKYRFNIVEDLFESIDDKKILKELKEKKARLKDIDTKKKYPIPKIVRATLRDYQKHGFEWLKFLDESGFGGILADDMGLGKTLQIITLLADQIDQAPSLVIVPRSLLFNWAVELDKFCPDLTYKIHHGPSRTKDVKSLFNNNIIITTYHIATNDIEMLKEVKFNYIILDESQAIKNPGSKRYKAMRLLQSRNKLAMTGTPIENNTFDLYAQLSFTSPGLLGGMSSFKNNFSVPIDNKGDIEASKLLRKLIHPFILRRTKEQVAKDLPKKTETIIYCEMGKTQRRLYEKLKNKIRKDIEEAIEEKGINQSKFQMLDGLLRLRQMCNSPLLINPSFSGLNADSVKIQTLMDNLSEALEQKHHSLVFSQFVSLLTIIKKELDARGIKYAYLDGSTTNRQGEVDKFMNNEEVKVFLISIKAGNTGMNLTKADYVYIIDPWWNPAVEAQAIDRTHRIGQKNQIFAYRLICKNSIEEKILKLQAKKKKLASDIIQTDENIMKSLNKNELLALFD